MLSETAKLAITLGLIALYVISATLYYLIVIKRRWG